MGNPSEHQVGLVLIILEEKEQEHEKCLTVVQAKERLFKDENHSEDKACSLQDWFSGEFLLLLTTSLKNYWAMKAFFERCGPLKDIYST